MFILECLLFSKGLKKDSLSYFSAVEIEVGSLINVPLRNKIIPALTISCTRVEDMKSEIKSADFQMKKIKNISSKPFLNNAFLKAVKETSEYFACAPGSILEHYIPKLITENPSLLISNQKQEKTISTNTKIFTQILQTNDEERYMYYKSLIREEFAKNKSIMICVPQNSYISNLKNILDKGIESFVFTISNDQSEKTIKETWQKVCREKHPIVLISTTKWISIPKNNISTIIIEKENDDGWKMQSRPFADARFFIESYAKNKQIRCILGDKILSTDTLYRYKNNEIIEYENVRWRIQNDIETNIIDIGESIKTEKKYLTITRELKNLIEKSQKENSHMLIFVARKGFSSTTICRDCGTNVLCNNCESPVVLYKTKEGGVFRCHQCGERRDAHEYCKKCNSWKLGSFGSGIDRIVEEIKENNDIKIFEINSEATKTTTRVRQTIEEFYKTKGSVLVCTELALPFITKKIEYSAIASFDSLFFIPDFKIHEKIFKIICTISSITKNTLLIQTRNKDEETLINGVDGNMAEFYKKEISDRKILDYPPFSVFIKITMRGTKIFVEKQASKLKDLLDPITNKKNYKTTFFPSMHEKKGENVAINTIVKINKTSWPDIEIVDLLKNLEIDYEIKVDPDNIL